jgi:tetratricopeptide (TPR) repeat protein
MQSLCCPISKKLPVCPVLAKDGKTYDRDTLFEQAFKNGGCYAGMWIDDTTTTLNLTHLESVRKLVRTATSDHAVQEWTKKRKKFEVEQRRREKKPAIDGDSKACIIEVCNNLLQIDDVKKAREYYDQHVIFTEQVDLLQINGRIYMREGEHRKAYEEFRKALLLRPKVTQDVYWDMCELFRAQGEHAMALQYNVDAEKKQGLRNKKKHIERLVQALEQGLGVEKNIETAKMWAKKLSSSYKDVEADMFLAKHESLAENTLVAVKFIDTAAKRKHGEAQELRNKINDVIVGFFDVSPSKRCCV